ncbi:MAG: MmgE/PrpD family protein, partial [Pseudomonadota bacterium]
GLSDRRVAAVLERITVREDPRHSARFPLSRWSDVTVTTREGRRLSSGDVHAKGGPEAPMALAEVEAKFHVMAAGLGAAQREAIWSMRQRLLAPDCLFSDLLRLVGTADG